MSNRLPALIARVLVVIALAALLPAGAQAQGHGHGHGHGPPGGTPPGQARKRVTVDRATYVTRDVLVKHGYEIVRVERVRETQVVYFRRGNRGRGRGLGPVEKLVIIPDAEQVRFERAPKSVLVDINVRLGL
jgi:hypothetical protein